MSRFQNVVYQKWLKSLFPAVNPPPQNLGSAEQEESATPHGRAVSGYLKWGNGSKSIERFSFNTCILLEILEILSTLSRNMSGKTKTMN